MLSSSKQISKGQGALLAHVNSFNVFTPARTPKRSHDLGATDKAASGKKPHVKGTNKENRSLKDDTMAEPDEFMKSGHWSDTDKTQLFEWLLGVESNKRFKIHNKNPQHMYDKAGICANDSACITLNISFTRLHWSSFLASILLIVSGDNTNAPAKCTITLLHMRSSPVVMVMLTFPMTMILIWNPMRKNGHITRYVWKVLTNEGLTSVHYLQKLSRTGMKRVGILFSMTGGLSS
jgi:hypothetical protein